MTSKYILCDVCKTATLDRKPVGIGRDGTFHSAEEICSYATRIGWVCIEGPGYNGGQQYCPGCVESDVMNVATHIIYRRTNADLRSEILELPAALWARLNIMANDQVRLEGQFLITNPELDRPNFMFRGLWMLPKGENDEAG